MLNPVTLFSRICFQNCSKIDFIFQAAVESMDTTWRRVNSFLLERTCRKWSLHIWSSLRAAVWFGAMWGKHCSCFWSVCFQILENICLCSGLRVSSNWSLLWLRFCFQSCFSKRWKQRNLIPHRSKRTFPDSTICTLISRQNAHDENAVEGFPPYVVFL